MARTEVSHSQPGELLTVRQVADLCGRHPETVYRWIRSDRLAVVNAHREFVIRREDLDVCLNQK